MLFKPRLEELTMTADKHTQKAGENSQLMQAGTINIYNNGIDEKRAREICAETYAIARRNFTADAYACANERVQKFEDSLLPKMQQIEGALSTFADPSFQLLLTSAQRTAAATERNADYDMLAELLVCRITKGQSRKNRTGISRAVEIVDKIDDDALCALTVVHAINMVFPMSGDCKEGLQVLNDLFDKLLYMDLPNGIDWIEHLDILDAIRMSSVRHFRKLNEYYPERLAGYSAAGIKIESEDYQKALTLLSEVGLNKNILIPNQLLDGYVKLPVVNKDAIKDISLIRSTTNSGNAVAISRAVNEREISVLCTIWDLYTNDNVAESKAKTEFMDLWDSYPALNKLHHWWDGLANGFTITHVGTVLAHTNARRCDNSIPELPLKVQ